MPVSLILTPDPLALTKGNRMRYQLQGSGRYQTLGSKSITVLEFRTPIPAGTVLNLRWNGKTVSIIAKTTPTQANEFLAGDGSSTYAGLLEPFFQSYFPFREDFEVHASDYGAYRGIVLTAKQPGPAYSVLGLNGATYLLGGPQVVGPFNVDPVAVGASPILRDRYSAYVELWLQKPGTPGTNAGTDFERVHDAIIEADDTGLAEFDAGDLLHGLLQADLPDFQQSLPTKAVNSHRAYFLSYGEAFGQPIRVGLVKNDIIRQAYLGGGDFEHRAGTGLALLPLVQGISVQEDKALRFGHRMRYVRPDEPQWLTFLNSRAAPQQAALLIRLIFEDSTVKVVSTAVVPFTFAPNDTWTLPVGVEQLVLSQHVPAGRTLSEYEVRLTVAGSDPGGNNHLSVAYRYVLSYGYERYVRHFAYVNSLGAIDTLTTFGKGTQELTRFYKQAQRSLTAEYSMSDGQFVEYDLMLQQQTEVTTGFRDKAEIRRWHDFYVSALRLRLRGTQAIQIGIVSKSIKQAKDDDTQFAHRFEYVDLHKDEFYAEEAEPPGDPTPPASLIVAGTPTITLPTGPVVYATDPTVPAPARELTRSDLTGLRQVIGVGLHTQAGYLTQELVDGLYFSKAEKIDYATALKNTPTTRDGYDLTDVLTQGESSSQTHRLIKNLIGIKPKLKSWTSDIEPA